MGQGGNMSVAPHTYKSVPYDALKDFAGIALNATNYLAVVANPKVPFKTATEMIAWAKANPGKLTVATNGEGGYPHLAFEYLAKLAGFSFLHVPYKGVLNQLTAGARPDGPREDELSPQERRVLTHVVEGKTNKQIAAALGLSDKTVKNYLSNAFQKLQVTRRSHAAVLFSRLAKRPKDA